MTNEIVFVLVALTFSLLVWLESSSIVKKYLLKWLAASFVMPSLVIIFFDGIPAGLTLIFWPGSIVLMSLGAEQRPIADVIYVWGFGICLNLILYYVAGLIFHLATRDKRQSRNNK